MKTLLLRGSVAMLCAMSFVGCSPTEQTTNEPTNQPANEPEQRAASQAHYSTALNAEDFRAKVEEGQGVALVDFWASWCGPCLTIAPTVEAVAKEYQGKVLVGKVDVDENQALARKHNISSIPALLVFKDGKEVERIIGVRPKADIVKALEAHLPVAAAAPPLPPVPGAEG